VEIDDIGRFEDVGKLHAYAGLTPSTYSSGERNSHGKIIKEGNRWLHWAITPPAE
jgi:transposase